MKLIKKAIVYLLVACLVITCIPPMEASAADDLEAKIQAGLEAELEANDGIEGRLAGNVPDEFYGQTSLKTRAAKTHNPRFEGYSIRNGIDVSHHQGVINWNKVAASGIEFAFVRVAGRGYGTAGNLFEDTLYEKNLKEARAAGLDVGVYIYSQAITQAEAREEAAYILERIQGYDINLPVVFDYEYYSGGRLSDAKLTDKQRTDICKAFCEAVKFKGYEPMIYANKSMLKNDLYADQLSADYKIWLAHYTSATDYEGVYSYWQHTSDGTVDGINGRVDMNFHYVEPGLSITKTTENSTYLEWAAVEEAEGYIIYRKTANGKPVEIARITDPAATTYKDTGLSMNTVYTYSLSYYTTNENNETVISDSGYPAQKTVTPLKLKKISASGSAVDAGTVKLTWKKEANGTGYQIQRYNSSTKKYETVKTVTSPNTVSYTNTGRKIGTTYKYRVRAFADLGGARIYGSYSDIVTVKTSSKLKKPVLTAKASSYTTNKLSWKKIPGATGYKVQKYNSSKKKWETIKTIKSGSTTSYSNTYLNSSTTYKYRVRATASLSGKTVNSSYSDTKSVKTKASRTGVVKKGPLNVRKGAGTKYGKLTKVKKGKKLTITGSTKSWYRIKIKVKGKYKTGYVLKKYVKLK